MSRPHLSKNPLPKIINRFSHKRTLFGAILNFSMKWRKKSSVLTVSENRPSNGFDSDMRFEVSSKVSAKCYKGIFFLHLDQLPIDQQYSILKWGALKTITIKTESTLLTDCIQYDEYENWYNKEYKQPTTILEQEIA